MSGDPLRHWVAEWWAGRGGVAGRLLSGLLLPTEAAFRAGVALRALGYRHGWLRVERAPVPVISVGNLAVGGTGKTPISAWLVRLLAEMGRSPALVLRGYGEDETLLHRELNPDVPVFVAERRIQGARAAASAGRDVVVLDDGFQHRALFRDLDVVLVAAERWHGSRRLLPRGPWREGEQGLARADVVLVTRKSASEEAAASVERDLRAFAPGALIVRGHIAPRFLLPLHPGAGCETDLATLRGESVLAVSAIAEPEPFAGHLREVGAEVELWAFPDHHEFSERDVRRTRQRAAGRRVVVTSKDAVKLRPLTDRALPAWVLTQQVVIESGAKEFRERLARVLRRGT